MKKARNVVCEEDLQCIVHCTVREGWQWAVKRRPSMETTWKNFYPKDFTRYLGNWYFSPSTPGSAVMNLLKQSSWNKQCFGAGAARSWALLSGAWADFSNLDFLLPIFKLFRLPIITKNFLHQSPCRSNPGAGSATIGYSYKNYYLRFLILVLSFV